MNTAKNAQTFDIADAVIARGVRAWNEERQSVAASRERWKAIGEALKIGRTAHPSNQAFGDWCAEHGFGDMDRRVRADALRVDWSVVQRLDNDVSHPTRIVAALRKLTAPPAKPKPAPKPTSAPPAPPPPFAQASTTPMDKRAAEKAAKTLSRANYGGEGAETARRMFEGMARAAGVSPEQFEADVKAGAPDTFHPFTPAAQAQIDLWRPAALRNLRALKTYGISKEALRDLLLNLVAMV